MWRLVILVILVGALGVACTRSAEPTPTATVTPTPPTPAPGQAFASLGISHIDDGVIYNGYNSVPPTSGPHYGRPAPWGIYTEPVQNERQVHNLEHGGVMIQYNSEDEVLIARLEEFAQRQVGFPCYLVVAPYPDMETTIAVTAWTVLDHMEEYDDIKFQAFVDAYRNNGPERVQC